MELVIHLLLFLSCLYGAKGAPSKRIINGRLVARGEAPFSASLWYMKPNAFTNNTGLHHVCGGSLVAPQWILTAAHCFSEQVQPGLSNLADWLVVLGENNQRTKEEGEQVFSVTAVFESPRFDLSVPTGDVALLKLNDSATLTSLVSTIPVDDDPTCAVPGKTCTAYGWGQRAEKPYGYGSELQYSAEMTIVAQEKCEADYADTPYTITNLELCAHGENQDACNGDSGGPLVCVCDGRRVLSGTTFYGQGCNQPAYPAVKTRLTQFAAWAAQTISQN